MKKALSLVFVLILMLGFVACNQMKRATLTLSRQTKIVPA